MRVLCKVTQKTNREVFPPSAMSSALIVEIPQEEELIQSNTKHQLRLLICNVSSSAGEFDNIECIILTCHISLPF